MKATKKHFKECALRIMCLLSTRKVNTEYANEWYRIIASDSVTNFDDASIKDYEMAIDYLLSL